MGHDIVKRVQQMVAKAESTDSAAEAESIMIKVRQMLDQHGISLLTVARYAGEYDPVGTTRGVYGFWAADNWMRKLSDAASWYYGVRVVWSKRGNYTEIAVVGRESCRAAYTAMLPYLRGQVNRLANQGWSRGHYPTVSKGRTQIGLALTYRLYALYWARDENAIQDPTGRVTAGINMLVPVDEVANQLAIDFPNVKSARETKDRVRPSEAAIRAAAEISLAEQLKEQGAPSYVIGKS